MTSGASPPADPNVQALEGALLQVLIDNLDHGITVFDRNLRLVLWNGRYSEMFNLPPGFLHRGLDFADLIRFYARRGEYGACDVESTVAERVKIARKFEVHRYERTRPDGTVVDIIG